MLAGQYFPGNRLIKGPFGKSYGNFLGKTEFEKVNRATRPTLQKVEQFLIYLVEVYMEAPGLTPDKLAIEVSMSFVRTARAVLLTKDLIKDEVDLIKVEVKLREALGAGGLPVPYHTGVGVEGVKVVKKDQAMSSIQPDTLPSVSFEDGQAVENVAVQARARKVVVGGRVQSVRAVRSIRKGSYGTVVALTKEPMVKWEDGSAIDVKGNVPVTRSIPIASLEGVEAAAPAKGVVRTALEDAVRTAPEPEKMLPMGVPWAMHTGTMGSIGLQHMVLAALYQVYYQRSAGPALVMIDKDAPGHARCLSDVKPGGLIVLPYVQDLKLVEMSAKGGVDRTLVRVTAGEAKLMCNIVPPSPQDAAIVPVKAPQTPERSGEETAEVDPERSGEEGAEVDPERSGSEEDEVESSPSFSNLFWKIYLNKTVAAESVGLDLYQMELSVPLCFVRIENSTARTASKAKGHVGIVVPFLSNSVELKRGDVLHHLRKKGAD